MNERDHDPMLLGRQTQPRRGGRGYLMLEAAVAGAVLTVVLVSLVGMVAEARVNLTKAAHRDAAAGLAAGKVSEIEANPSRATFSTGPVAVGATHPGYEWTFALADADTVETNTDCDGAPLTASQLYRITATVTYPTPHASTDDMSDGVADQKGAVTITRLVR